MTPEQRAVEIERCREVLYDLREEIDEGHYQPQIVEQLQWYERELKRLEKN